MWLLDRAKILETKIAVSLQVLEHMIDEFEIALSWLTQMATGERGSITDVRTSTVGGVLDRADN